MDVPAARVASPERAHPVAAFERGRRALACSVKTEARSRPAALGVVWFVQAGPGFGNASGEAQPGIDAPVARDAARVAFWVEVTATDSERAIAKLPALKARGTRFAAKLASCRSELATADSRDGGRDAAQQEGEGAAARGRAGQGARKAIKAFRIHDDASFQGHGIARVGRTEDEAHHAHLELILVAGDQERPGKTCGFLPGLSATACG